MTGAILMASGRVPSTSSGRVDVIAPSLAVWLLQSTDIVSIGLAVARLGRYTARQAAASSPDSRPARARMGPIRWFGAAVDCRRPLAGIFKKWPTTRDRELLLSAPLG